MTLQVACAEDTLGRAFSGQERDGLFLTSKVYPWNAAKSDTIAACERPLDRLQTDRIDLYLLHWSGPVLFRDQQFRHERGTADDLPPETSLSLM